jgi:hypothetical protein
MSRRLSKKLSMRVARLKESYLYGEGRAVV